jgi:hypothetical protein
MIAIGMPHGEQQDEDGLDREHDGDGGGGDDIAADAIMSIVNHLKNAKASAVRDVRAFADSLYELCEAFMERNRPRFEEAAHEAREALSNLISED